MVVWLIGLSGAGKTTLAEQVVHDANKDNLKTVLIDGDVIREIFNNDLGYSREDRLKNAQRVCQLSKFLSDQNINVVCAILSIFPETRLWNKNNIDNYYEVFIDTPIETLVKRDSKGLYSKFQRGEITNVAGMDIDFPIPEDPDLVINNNGSKEDLLNYSKQIIEVLKK